MYLFQQKKKQLCSIRIKNTPCFTLLNTMHLKAEFRLNIYELSTQNTVELKNVKKSSILFQIRQLSDIQDKLG